MYSLNFKLHINHTHLITSCGGGHSAALTHQLIVEHAEAMSKEKILFIDTEHSKYSVSKYYPNNNEEAFKNVTVLRPNEKGELPTFEELEDFIDELNPNLLVISSINNFNIKGQKQTSWESIYKWLIKCKLIFDEVSIVAQQWVPKSNPQEWSFPAGYSFMDIVYGVFATKNDTYNLKCLKNRMEKPHPLIEISLVRKNARTFFEEKEPTLF